MNLRDDKNKKKLLEEFNNQSNSLASIIKRRSEILDSVSVMPGQIWERTNGSRVMVTSITKTSVHFMAKSGKSTLALSNSALSSFQSNIFTYVGEAGKVVVDELLGWDGTKRVTAAEKKMRQKAVSKNPQGKQSVAPVAEDDNALRCSECGGDYWACDCV